MCASVYYAIISLDIGMLPIRHQAIICTSDDILLIELLLLKFCDSNTPISVPET